MLRKSHSIRNGISLISLVISIVIMLILASAIIVSIVNSDYLSTITQGNNKYKLAQLQENLEIVFADFNIKSSTNEIHINDGSYNVSELEIDFGNTQPNTGWVYIENKTITRYALYFDDFYVLKSDNYFYLNEDFNIKDINTNTLINVKNFGAKGDGKTDDTAAIREAVSYLNNNGGTLYFPTGNYIVSVSTNQESIITLTSDKEIKIDFCASTITLKGNEYTHYDMVNVIQSTNVEIKNGFLVGDRTNHNYEPGTTSHCWGYGIRIVNTLKCNIYNMDISQFIGDGIVNSISEVGGVTTIDTCNIHHCRRLGIQIADADIVNVNNTSIHHIGDFDGIAGVNPKSGIDLEPVYGTKKINSLNIENTVIEDVTLYGIVKADQHIVNNFTINNCAIDNISTNSAKIHNSTLNFNNTTGTIKGSEINNCYINLTEFVGGTLAITEEAIISNSVIEGIDINKTNSNGCSVRYITDNCSVNNTLFKNILGIPGEYTSSINDYGIIMNSNTNLKNWHDNIYENCSFGLALKEFKDTNSIIKDSYILLNTAEITFEQLQIINTDTSNGIWPNSKVFINQCTWNNSGLFGKRKIYINNSDIIFDMLDTSLYAELIASNNSTFYIHGDCIKDAFKSVTFTNNSLIVLKQYNSSVKLNIPNSTEGTDYTVKYNGTKALIQ